MASRKPEDLHDILREAYEKAVIRYSELHPSASKPFLTCTYRSNEEQEQLFKQVPPVTRARASQSAHNYLPSFAFDIAFLQSGKLDWSVVNFKNFASVIIGIDDRIEWGGGWTNFRDNPHYQLRNWKALK